MVGNDIVDLRDPESQADSLHPRFDARVFTSPERDAIAAGEGAPRTRWKLWAAKESAYKLLRKQKPSTVFSPVRFQVSFDGPAAALVTHGHDEVSVVYRENEGAVHAVARAEGVPAAAVLSGWRPLSRRERSGGDPETPSRGARALACERVAERLGVAAAALEVRRAGRVPFLWQSGRRLPADLSLSHHGDWLGFACVLRGAAL